MFRNNEPFFQLRFWLITVVLFALAFLWCGYYNRPASDDFEFLRMLRNEGWNDSALVFRYTWNTRWISILWLNTWLLIYENTGSLLPYHVCTLAALWLSTRYFITAFQHLQSCTTVTVWLISGCLAASLFYASFSISDSWFWANTSAMYGWSHVYGLAAAGALLRTRLRTWELVLLLLCGLGIGGGNEPFALTTLLCCAAIPVAFRISGMVLTRQRLLKLTVLFAAALFAFLVAYTGHGHTVRSGMLPDLTVLQKSWVLLKSLIKLFAIFLPVKLPAMLLLLMPFFFLGSTYQGTLAVKKTGMTTILVFVVLCVISLAPVVWLMSEMGPERAWSQITLYFVCASAILLFIAGYSFRMSKASYNMLQLTGVLSILMVIATGGSAVIRAGLYSHAWDERMAMLQEQSKKVSEVQDTIKLAPLPDSGWLHSAEISTDPEHFTNRHLRQYLEMDQPIVKSIPGTTTNGSP